MADPPTPEGWYVLGHRRIPVVRPYRLDLTVAVLRRTPQNLVDILTPDCRYLRALSGAPSPRVLAAWQPQEDGPLEIGLYSPAPDLGTDDPTPGLLLSAGRALGTAVDLQGFYKLARREEGLAEIARAARGVKPPRYPSLWEAICNAVVYQQVSIEAASSTMWRFITQFSAPVLFGDHVLYPFPQAAAVLRADRDLLRSVGLSTNKARALQEAASALLAGRLAGEDLEGLSSPEAAVRLTAHRGVGPWTAAVILLRGFGRLDVFPAGDSGARRSIRGLLGPEIDADAALESLPERLGPWRGMLYYHVLLWRLNQRGIVTLSPIDR